MNSEYTITQQKEQISDEEFNAYKSLIEQLSINGDITVIRTCVDEIITSPFECLFFAREKDGAIVGTARLSILLQNGGRSGVVDDVVVDKDHRMNGIGRALMTRIELEAYDRDLLWVDLTSRYTRTEAHALYKSMGYTQEETAVFSKDFS